jgi:hypothetical protein
MSKKLHFCATSNGRILKKRNSSKSQLAETILFYKFGQTLNFVFKNRIFIIYILKSLTFQITLKTTKPSTLEMA